MNQERIGKFIARLRKSKNITQLELAEKLGVTDRSVSNWENGKNMPDLSLFKPLCEILGITINELLSGEKLNEDEYQEKFEKNIVNTINYSKKEIEKEKNKRNYIILIIGSLISISSIIMFDAESSWSSFYSIVGMIIFVIGLFKMLKTKNIYKRISISVLDFVLIFTVFYVVDMISVVSFTRPPMYRYKTETGNTTIVYYSVIYNVYRINRDTPNEYYIVDIGKKQTESTISITPFNRDKSGIDNIINYQNKYIGNNSNVGNLISNLPLLEYGYVFEIDSKNYGLTIDYNTTDWYNNENSYIEQAVVYNSVSIFMLIDNLKTITFNFSGSSYKIDRVTLENNFPKYSEIINNGDIDKNKFNMYIENKINDIEFVTKMFNLFEKIK